MDAFYAAVEQLDDPALAGKPLLIGSPSNRGVVTTASYEARPYGVGSAMPMAHARRLCPQAIVIPPRMSRYVEVSKQVMEVFDDFSPSVEPLSLDEAFLDMSGAHHLFGTPTEIGRAIKTAVHEATGGLNISVGVATTKYVAKVASDHDKPDGLTVVPPQETLRFLHPLPVSRLWGAGPKVQARLGRMGLRTIGEVAAVPQERLMTALGRQLGRHLATLARAEDPRRVTSDREQRSIGSERTLEHDVKGRSEIEPHLLHAADLISWRLRKNHLLCRGVRVRLKTRRFKLHTRQVAVSSAIDSADDFFQEGVRLLDAFDLSEPMRLVGMAAFDLVDSGQPTQQDLFGEPRRMRRALERAVDELNDRFGTGTVRRASHGGD